MPANHSTGFGLTVAKETGEVWKDVIGFEGIYKVSDLGRVKSLKRKRRVRALITVPQRILKSWASKSGHLNVRLYRNGKSTTSDFGVHVLVLTNFVGPCPEGMQCRHLDGNPKNNKVGNLKWGTPQENMDDREKHGGTRRGSTSGMSKVTEADVLEIDRLLIEWKGKRGYMSRIAERFGIAHCSINSIRDRRTWKHVPKLVQ